MRTCSSHCSKTIRNVVFDLDGTLLDSAPDILRVLAEVLEHHRLVPRLPLGRALIGPPITEMLAGLVPEAAHAMLPLLRSEFRRRYDQSTLPDTQPFPGIVQCLEMLTTRGCRLFVATNKPSRVSERLVQQRFPSRFERVMAVDSVPGQVLDKPQMLARLGLEPDDSAMVGDQPADIRAGQTMGFATIAVLFGYGTPDELRAASPNSVVTCPDQIAPALGFL